MDETITETSAPQPPAPRPALLSVIAWFRDLMLSVLIAVLVILFLYRPVKVEGTSMMPTLLDQERLFINQFSYKFGLGDIKRGDTVVFWYPDPSNSVSYIKRVIGLPGDTVEAKDGYVMVNGKQLDENYVPVNIAMIGHTHLLLCLQTSTLCWAITAFRRMTAERGDLSHAITFTEKRFSCSGRWNT